MNGTPEGGTVLITGGFRGLGLELARQFAGDGWQVIAAGRGEGHAGRGGRIARDGIEVLTLDMADPASIARAGIGLAGRPIDILINNAAIRGATGGLATVETEDFLEVMRINALGPALLVRTDMGGAQADLSLGESACGLKILIERATMADTATFRTHDGERVGW